MKHFVFGLIAAMGVALGARAQVPEYPNDAGKYLSGAGTWVLRNVLSLATLAPASAGTNYGIDLTSSSGGLILMTNHVTITGLTNNAAGATYQLLIVNVSGSDFVLRTPSTAFTSMISVSDSPMTVSNQVAAIVEIAGYGSNTTNALYRIRRCPH